MKKFIAAMLSVVGASCFGLALSACNDEPVYYKLSYENDKAVTVDFRGIESGAEVKEGYTVEFTCTLAEGAEGDPSVLVNGVEIYPDLDGVYSFVMSQDTEVTFENAVVLSNYRLNFDKGDYRIKYNVISDGKSTECEGVDVKMGDKVNFSIDVSVYYGESDYTVLANTTVLMPESDGSYTVTVTEDTNITVMDLEVDDTFLDRPDGGKGTKESPYLVERPIDLYLMADRINDDWYMGRYGSAYYKLNADIDMKGEQLYVIGDYISGSYSFFSGEFDGNGKTISNFYIDDVLIEQSAYTEVPLPYIGLFGYAVATYERAPYIHDLTLDNFTIEVDAAKSAQSCTVGGVVGLGVGAEISNCTVNGTITVDADDSQFSYAGGIIGFQQSAYVSESLKYYSKIDSCSADIVISGDSGNLYAAGGIAGYSYAHEEKTAAYIINSYSSGMIYGAMNAGGVVGYLSPYSSVKNCYSVCDSIEAYCRNGYTAANARFAYSYAGGIVGYADSDSIVSNCFAIAQTEAYAQAGTKYAYAGDIVGQAAEASAEVVDSKQALVIKCYGNDDVTLNSNFFTKTLGWNETDWSFGGEYPVAKSAEGTRTVTVTIDYGDNKVDGNNTVEITLDEYLPVSAWYVEKIDQFVNSGDLRSYGYFFAKDGQTFSLGVPYSYVLTGGETLYVGFANYSEVAGKYYLSGGDGAYIELGKDGSLQYMNGARNYLSYYTYDGESAILYSCPALTETIDENSISYSTGRAVLSDGTLTIVNNATYTEASPLTAVKEISGFLYGTYYAGSTDYVFNYDGTGKIGSANITYTVAGSVITVYNNREVLIGEVENGTVVKLNGVDLVPYDMFKGVWEKSATSHKQFEFDGKGGWSYVYFKYNSQGLQEIISQASGTYVYNSADEKIVLKDENNLTVGEASYNDDGFLDINYDSVTITYYKNSSYVGVWRYFFRYEAITLTLNGIGEKGYGIAYVDYESGGSTTEMTYEIVSYGGTDYIYLYYGDVNYGVLSYNTLNYTLMGSMYSYALDGIVGSAMFCLTDDFKGVWMSSELNAIEFNGFGSYDLAASNETFSTKTYGTVKIGGKTVTYKLNDSTMSGSFEFNGITYNISYDDGLGIVNVTTQSGSFVMMRRDALYGADLCDENGTAYVFNGGGLLEKGGTLTVGDDTYTYKIVNDNIEVYLDSEKIGVISVVGNEYVFNKTDSTSVTLSVRNNFTGEWLVGGGINKTLTIGKIGADGKAQGTYLGEAVTFTYNSTGKYLSFEWQNSTLYIISLSAASSVELAISAQDNTFGEFELCLAADKLDDYCGTYVAADKSYIVLDGFGNSRFSKGKATLYSADGSVVKVYRYLINKFGMPEIIDNGRLIFKQVSADAEGAYKLGDKAYSIVTADFLYNVIASKDGVQYTFDGVGGMTDSLGNSYAYADAVRDTKNNVVNMVVTSSDGVVYRTAQLDYGTTNYIFSLTDVLQDKQATDDAGKTYVFDGRGGMTDSQGNAYTYSEIVDNSTEKVISITVTATDGKVYEGKVEYGSEEGYKLTLTEKAQ
ncbi:MAG: GLUG motif-containing protein [Candidatus Coproplasma sp.]